jgi:DNA polymerase-1
MKDNPPQKFILIDGNALIHRAFHALPPLTSKKGELVNAVFGFTSILLKAIKDLKPTHIAVAFDSKGPTFRHKEFHDYKATRVAAPEELYQQFSRVKEVVKALNIPSYEVSGFEADDIIGTLSKKLTIDNVIVTGDLDELQLVDQNTKVYIARKGVQDTVIYDEKKVIERYGIKAEQLIDFKGLRGDPSDNIPGVKGIGEKTAAKLLQKLGTIEKLYKKLEKEKKIKGVPDRVIKILLEQKEKAFLSKKLATIVTNMPLKINLNDCVIQDYDREKVVKLFQELEFKTLLSRLPESSRGNGKQASLELKVTGVSKDQKVVQNQKLKETGTKSRISYELIETKEKFVELLDRLTAAKEFAIDTETTSAQAVEAKLLGISFAIKPNHAFYLPADKIWEWDSLKLQLKNILESNNTKKTAHNAKYDFIVLKNSGFELAEVYFDTMIASYILNPSSRRHSLNDLAFQELGYEMMSFEDLVGKGKERKDISEVDIKKLAFYSCEDVDITLKLKNIFEKKLKKEKKLLEIFRKIEMRLIWVLAKMETAGIKIDTNFLGTLSKNFARELKKLENKIYNLAGTRKFNINSTQQLSKILFEKLQIPNGEVKKNIAGYSTAAQELAKIRKNHSIVPLIERYREYTKLKNTYIDALPELVNKKTGRVHTSFNQTITATGRLSSSDPNLQNIPIRTDIGREIRKAFVADSGFKILSADYSQIELRLAAHISSDPNMLRAFKSNEDIHTSTAAKIFKKDVKNVSSQERRFAKTINFGVLYGMSPYGLSRALEIDHEEAQLFIDQYFQNFSAVAVYIKNTLEFARKNGYVETLLGRKRYLPELVSGSPQIQAAAERMAINAPIQGTAADIIKMAMNELNNQNLVLNPDCKLLLQVHDELVFEIKKGKLTEYAQKIKQIMENIYKLQIPLKIDLSYGENWGEMEEL